MGLGAFIAGQGIKVQLRERLPLNFYVVCVVGKMQVIRSLAKAVVVHSRFLSSSLPVKFLSGYELV